MNPLGASPSPSATAPATLPELIAAAICLLAATMCLAAYRSRRLLRAERIATAQALGRDELTGLARRDTLLDRLDRQLRSNPPGGCDLALLLLDVNRFNHIIDTFGHQFGDLLLAGVAARLSTLIRHCDDLARVGRDEFAVLLPDVGGQAAAIATADRFLRAIQGPFLIQGVDVDAEVTVGVALAGIHGVDAATLLQRAHVATHVARSQGIGVSVYNPATDRSSPAQLSLLGGLRRAIAGDELILHYQPKISLEADRVVGVEALVRWRCSDGNLVAPGDFIPLAERTALIGPLTRRVLDLALAQARTWIEAGTALPVAVNLSARNLHDEHFPDTVAQLLADHDVPAHLLELEVTESALMIDPARARRLLDRLIEVGVSIAIDDFGAGYTSLGQLKTLPISTLKIDRSFVTTLSDRNNALIVANIIDLAHQLGLKIVAEGVETPETITALATFGCDAAQGYHLCEPLSAGDFDNWHAHRRIGRNSAPVVAAEGAPAPRHSWAQPDNVIAGGSMVVAAGNRPSPSRLNSLSCDGNT